VDITSSTFYKCTATFLKLIYRKCLQIKLNGFRPVSTLVGITSYTFYKCTATFLTHCICIYVYIPLQKSERYKANDPVKTGKNVVIKPEGSMVYLPDTDRFVCCVFCVLYCALYYSMLLFFFCVFIVSFIFLVLYCVCF
jgi:hypothetical protein